VFCDYMKLSSFYNYAVAENIVNSSWVTIFPNGAKAGSYDVAVHLTTVQTFMYLKFDNGPCPCTCQCTCYVPDCVPIHFIVCVHSHIHARVYVNVHVHVHATCLSPSAWQFMTLSISMTMFTTFYVSKFMFMSTSMFKFMFNLLVRYHGGGRRK
jgi:hypothetical protein